MAAELQVSPEENGHPDVVPDDALVYTVKQTARVLQISETLCYGLVRSGKLPALRWGERAVRIPREGLGAWLLSEAQKTDQGPTRR